MFLKRCYYFLETTVITKKLNESCPQGGGAMEALCSIFLFYLKFLLCFKKNKKVEEKNYVDGR